MSVIVALEEGVWLSDGVGDPPRTLKKENALIFSSHSLAVLALKKARKYRPFLNAAINRQTNITPELLER